LDKMSGQPANVPTQFNSLPPPDVVEPVFTEEDQELIKQFRQTVQERMVDGLKKIPGGWQPHDPPMHWRDVYASHAHLTAVKITPDPRGLPDLDKKWYSPSTQPENWSDALCHKFLRARQRDVSKAADMFLNNLYFRETYGVDDLIRQTPMPFNDLYESILAHNIHRPDKEGRPIYLQRTGLINPSDFVTRVDEELLVLGHMHFMERCMIAMEQSSIANHKRVETLITAIDTKGLYLGHSKMVKMFKTTTGCDQWFYPETLGAFYMLNAPSLLPTVYGLIKPLLDPVTQEKIHLLSGRSMNVILDKLGAQHVPKEYGGECECEGGCLPFLNQVCAEDTALVTKYEEGAEEHTIKVTAGKSVDVVIEVTGSAEHPVTQLWWSFKIQKQNIIFSGTFDNGTVTYPVAQPLKMESDDVIRGVYTFSDMDKASNHGKVTLKFDNGYSRWNGKTLVLKYGLVEKAIEESVAV